MRHLSIARLALVGAILAAAVVPSTAAAADSSVAGAAAAGRMTVKVDIARFKATKSGPVIGATGTSGVPAVDLTDPKVRLARAAAVASRHYS